MYHPAPLSTLAAVGFGCTAASCERDARRASSGHHAARASLIDVAHDVRSYAYDGWNVGMTCTPWRS